MRNALEVAAGWGWESAMRLNVCVASAMQVSNVSNTLIGNLVPLDEVYSFESATNLHLMKGGEAHCAKDVTSG